MKSKQIKEPIRLSEHFGYRKLLRFCLPTMIMMAFTSIYGVVDGLFVSNFVGKNAFAAINIAIPALMICGAVGTMFGTGGTALISKTLGEGNKKRANEYFSMILEMTAILGAIVTIVGFLLMPLIVQLLGATGELYDDALLYGRICIVFIMAMQFQYMFQALINAAEKPKLGLFFTIAAGLTNMLLDAVFVAGLNMGIAGAAIATGISECIGGVLPLIYFIGPNSSLLRFRPVKIILRPVLLAAYNGVSELMSNISMSVVSMVYNLQLIKYSGADGVAAYGVIMYVQFIFISLMFGYTLGTAPIIGFHFGAGHHKELNNLLKKSMKLEYGGGILLFIVAQLCVYPISALFVGYDSDLLLLTVHAFRIFLMAFLLSGGNIFASAFFTALSNGTISAIISFVRSLVFELISVLVLPLFFGIDGIWCAVFVAEIGSAIMSWLFLFRQNKKYKYFKGSFDPSSKF